MGGSTDCYDSGVELLAEWLKTQHHLPQHIGKILLRRFFHASQGVVEDAQKLIDLNYTMRNSYAHIFLKRDPCDEKSQEILKSTNMIILPNLTPDGDKLLYYCLNDSDPDKFCFNDSIRMFFMMADLRFNTPDPAGICDGEIPIFDMTGFTLRHLTKVVFSTMRIYMKFTQEATPIRLKAIHLINCSTFLDKVITLIKPFIRSEVFKLIHFHLPESDTLYEHVPKEMLPTDIGGQGGYIADIKKEWVTRLAEEREYLTHEKYWKVDETKRKTAKRQSKVLSSLLNLSID